MFVSGFENEMSVLHTEHLMELPLIGNNKMTKRTLQNVLCKIYLENIVSVSVQWIFTVTLKRGEKINILILYI